MVLKESSAKHSRNNRSFEYYTNFSREEKMEYSPTQYKLDTKTNEDYTGKELLQGSLSHEQGCKKKFF